MATVLACRNPTSTTNTSEAEKAPDKSELANLGDRIVIDTDSSLVFWKGTKPTGDIHVGTVNIKEGILYIANGNVKGGMFVMDMNSILVTDEDMSEKGKRKLKKHLTNEDFFETNNFPEANGGRVLNITARGDTLKEAQERAYSELDKVDWEGGFYRRDIGWRAL